MAIGAGAAGAWAATNATTHTVTLPAHAAGNLLIVIAACKASTITSVDQSITTPSTGWTRAAQFADGTTNAGNGLGSVNQAIFWRVATSSSETNPVVTWGGSQTAAPGIAVGLCFTDGGSESWNAPAVVQAATTNATTISVTMGSNPGITSGDWGVISHTTRDDSALTVPTWTATSATLATVVIYPATPIASGTSNDMAGTSAYRSVTSGTASAAPVVTGTQVAAETGVTCFIRLRVSATQDISGGFINQTATIETPTVSQTQPVTLALIDQAATIAAPTVYGSYGSAVFADSPTGYWRLGETSGTVADNAAGASYDGTYTGTYTQGATGLLAGDADKALSIGGAGWVFVSSFDAAIQDTFSIEAWVNWTGTPANGVIVGRGTNGYAVSILADGTVHLEKWNVDAICTSTVAVTAGVTTHIVVTKSGAAVKIWINGVDRTGTVLNQTITANWNELGIGADRTGAQKFSGGVLDEVAIYPTALSEARVLAHFNAGGGTQSVSLGLINQTATISAPTVYSGYAVIVLADSPVAYWRLGEPSGTNAVDVMGANNGTYVNSPTLGVTGALTGDSNTAVTFNGTTQNITVADSSPFRAAGTASFSIEAWFKHVGNFTSRQIASCMSGVDGWELTHYNGNISSSELSLGRYPTTGLNTWGGWNGATAYLDANWHHVVGTYDGATLRLYLDGAPFGLWTDASPNSLPSTGTFKIGGDTVFWDGSLDEVAFYNTALSADRIAVHYVAGGGILAKRQVSQVRFYHQLVAH